MVKALPDRWAEYTPIGRRIEGTRFIAFKVPLRTEISNRVPSTSLRLNIKKLLSLIPNLGLVIDLTSSYRYYDPTAFLEKGIQHKKILTEGCVVPKKRLLETFRDTVEEFLKENQNNDKLIGVHCTHGINRTGYYICNHLIEMDRLKPKMAIERFERARGHAIERKNYIDSLYKNYELQNRFNRRSPEITSTSSAIRSSEISSTSPDIRSLEISSTSSLSWRTPVIPTTISSTLKRDGNLPRREVISSVSSSSTSWRDKPDNNYIPFHSRKAQLEKSTEHDRKMSRLRRDEDRSTYCPSRIRRREGNDRRREGNDRRRYQPHHRPSSRDHSKYNNHSNTFTHDLDNSWNDPSPRRNDPSPRRNSHTYSRSVAEVAKYERDRHEVTANQFRSHHQTTQSSYSHKNNSVTSSRP